MGGPNGNTRRINGSKSTRRARGRGVRGCTTGHGSVHLLADGAASADDQKRNVKPGRSRDEEDGSADGSEDSSEESSEDGAGEEGSTGEEASSRRGGGGPRISHLAPAPCHEAAHPAMYSGRNRV